MRHHDVLIVGGGNAGVSLAARLLRDGAPDVALVESETVHRYRPLLNYVGAGEAVMASLERAASDVVPDGCTWISDRVVSVDLEPTGEVPGPVVHTGGGPVSCRALVLCTGLEEDWDATPGLAEAYADGWAASTFTIDGVTRVWPALSGRTRGRVLFTVPPEPAPCAATALKPLFMACDHWRRAGVLDDIDVTVVLPRSTPVGDGGTDHILGAAFASYGVAVVRDARVTRVAPHQVRVRTPAGEVELDDVDFAHVVPHYRAPDWVVRSGLSDGSPAGLVDIDPETLRHRAHPAVWSIGDVAAVATPPSGGALRKQVEVLAHNLAAAAAGKDGRELRRYDGYTVMPITTGRHELMLLEVDRTGRRVPTVPFPDLVRPRHSTWLLDRYALPQTYFRRILRGKV
ncbi:sulfide:quinone oxidoreductase [Nocardioides cavernae]|uniref:Sulfide:quinone oxidoreductase n=1 Tax=Nocardioides cavernae TaxID=1921566 RepID=A0A7Y9KT19_9ACTN|nr:FAD/NAD(P)-binding oxidoreductase [Nocardioides cavernae]NYE38144.1 sulfide:quinone oxidoreductase [Nocardioides cavernae]